MSKNREKLRGNCELSRPRPNLNDYCSIFGIYTVEVLVGAPKDLDAASQVCTAQYFVWYFSLASLVLPFIAPARRVRLSSAVQRPGAFEMPVLSALNELKEYQMRVVRHHIPIW